MFQYHFTMKRLLLITLCTCFLLTEGKTQSIPDTLKKLNISDLPFQITHKDSDPATEEEIDFTGPGKKIDQTYKIENGKFILKSTEQQPVIIRNIDLFVPGKSYPLLTESLEEKKIRNLPFNYMEIFKDREENYELPYSTEELVKQIPINNSYLDINATIKDTTFDDTEVLMRYRFADQEGRYFFFADARYACDSSISDYLILMDKDGTVSDYLWAGLFFSTGKHLFPMSFKIDESGLITVYRIQSDPKSKAIDPNDESITSFKGQRTDTTYRIENGKFVLKNTKNYPQKVYRMSDLVNGRFIFDTKEAFKEDDFFL